MVKKEEEKEEDEERGGGGGDGKEDRRVEELKGVKVKGQGEIFIFDLEKRAALRGAVVIFRTSFCHVTVRPSQNTRDAQPRVGRLVATSTLRQFGKLDGHETGAARHARASKPYLSTSCPPPPYPPSHCPYPPVTTALSPTRGRQAPGENEHDSNTNRGVRGARPAVLVGTVGPSVHPGTLTSKRKRGEGGVSYQ